MEHLSQWQNKRRHNKPTLRKPNQKLYTICEGLKAVQTFGLMVNTTLTIYFIGKLIQKNAHMRDHVGCDKT